MGYASYPNPSFGYFRGVGSEGPLAGGQGSNMGPKMQGLGIFSQGQGPAGSSGWTPTILYLLGFVIVEMIIVHLMSRMLR